jgi:hypothetical protein
VSNTIFLHVPIQIRSQEAGTKRPLLVSSHCITVNGAHLQCTGSTFTSVTTRKLSPPILSTNKQKFVALVRERTIPTERPRLLVKLVQTFANSVCCVVSTTDPYLYSRPETLLFLSSTSSIANGPC